ncbi:MAG: hypothetical protein HYU86_08370 [Chloroflexi bacterium]|nr:hypothetical protein [Chloroflexota bacterium]
MWRPKGVDDEYLISPEQSAAASAISNCYSDSGSDPTSGLHKWGNACCSFGRQYPTTNERQFPTTNHGGNRCGAHSHAYPIEVA